MDFDFKNRIAVVTGGARGIGFAIAKAFYQQGATVIILDVDTTAGDQIQSWGNRGFYIQCDVADEKAIQQAFTYIEKKYSQIHYLINNAGILHLGSVVETTKAEWDRVIGTNLTGPFLCAHYALPLMQKAQTGVVVTMASILSFQIQKRMAAYASAKAGLLGLIRSIAVDYGPPIRSVGVAPGTVDTPMLEWALANSKDPEADLKACAALHCVNRIAQPEEVANFVLYLCSDQASFVTGQTFRFDGGQGILLGGLHQDTEAEPSATPTMVENIVASSRRSKRKLPGKTTAMHAAPLKQARSKIGLFSTYFQDVEPSITSPKKQHSFS